jgi:drug/metabolite transporter (DMT)-like permease
MGLVSTLGQQALVRGFRAAEASVVAPFNYSRLIFAALLAYLFFGEVADLWTWVGATVIFGATVYSARREIRPRHVIRSTRP